MFSTEQEMNIKLRYFDRFDTAKSFNPLKNHWNNNLNESICNYLDPAFSTLFDRYLLQGARPKIMVFISIRADKYSAVSCKDMSAYSKRIKRNDFASTRWSESLGTAGKVEHPSNFAGQIKSSVTAVKCNLALRSPPDPFKVTVLKYSHLVLTATFVIFLSETPVHFLIRKPR